MAEYQILSWRSIPSMVVARDGRRTRHSVQLSPRFQIAIDELAMRLGLTGTDAYLDAWERTEWQAREGDVETVAETVAGELDRAYPPERLRALTNDKEAQ
jgi:hypothetical protein